MFTEDDTASFLNGVNYHNRDIGVELGIELAGGSVEYHRVATMRVSSVGFDSKDEITIRVYDMVRRMLDEKVNCTPSTMVAVANAGNTGDGDVSEIDTKPFATVTENWTLTCTLGGADSTATFSVVGSVSGNVGTATSGTEFSNAAVGGIKFTIQAGDADWVIGDKFTFSTAKTREWLSTNPIKILLSILTGYNYNTNVADPWLTRTPQLDRTQSSANTDINWPDFKKAVDDATDALFTLKGYVPWDYDLVDVLEEIVFHFLGAIFVDPLGRLTVKVFRPEMIVSPMDFADSKKNTKVSYVKDVKDVINNVSVRYRKLDVWPWSDENESDTLDGVYVASNSASFTALGQWFGEEFESRWYNQDGSHVVYLATRVIDKYGLPPRLFTIETGIDGLEAEIGDIVTVTDTKFQIEGYEVEVMKKDAEYGEKPIKITLEAEDTGTRGIGWAFLGSSADEGDGLSPQAPTFDTATEMDKMFCYLSQTGGSGLFGLDKYLF